MKTFVDRKGMTLVEVIVSITIFSIMSVAFMNVFLGSYLITTRAGARTDSVAFISGEMDKTLAGLSYAAETTNITSAPGVVTIEYLDGSIGNINGTGFVGNVLSTKGQTIEINYFLPEE